jgi:hypothetical protein
MKKTLVASGCSFTFEPWNWPTFVAEEMNYDLINVGMGSQGNGLISKKLIYKVTQELKTKRPEDIIVGVMWSGIDRNEFYVENQDYPNIDGWIENPTSVVEGNRNWLITNIHWKTKQSNMWYEYFHTDIGTILQTIQNILFTQWFLERNGIKYFMTTYLDIFNQYVDNMLLHPEVEYMFKQIDFSKFIPIDGCREWIVGNYPTEGFTDVTVELHPNEFGHQRFSEEVVVPFIKTNLL